MKIGVYGLWHLGCVTAACLADAGFEVIGYDPDATVIKQLQAGQAPLFEPGLNDLIAAGIASGRLTFSHQLSDRANTIDMLWVTFDTPVNEHDEADVASVEKHILTILPHLTSGTGIVISSQVPVGFTQALEARAKRLWPDQVWHFAYSPENLRLGNAIAVFKQPERIVIGIINPAERQKWLPLFSPLCDHLEWMLFASAEMTKHAINAFLATSVVFANEIAELCETVGASASEVARGLKSDSRIGQKAYVKAGLAFAGGTLARDIGFLIELGRARERSVPLFNAVKKSNERHKSWLERTLKEALSTLNDKKITLLGLTYKPNTDTLRRSLAIELALRLVAMGARVTAYDPFVQALPANLNGRIELAANLEYALADADAIVVATEHAVFKERAAAVKSLVQNSVVLDPNGFLATPWERHSHAAYYAVGESMPQRLRDA